MSYLNVPRLVFAGRFQASISTVNNDPVHFDIKNFKSEYQERGEGGTNGWFNPAGDASWRLLGCKVTSAWRADGSTVGPDDPILHDWIADSDRMVAAKLVDLDSEQQLVSEIWGLEVRICDPNGNTLLRSQFEPAAFMDIWKRAAGKGDETAGAMYQSVLTNLEWGDISNSGFLQDLKASAKDGLLSIKFNVDGLGMDFNKPNEFLRGRIVGSIGPATAEEPHHFVLGRQFMATQRPGNPSFFKPTGKINFCAAVVDQLNRKIYLDLGNALPTRKPGGKLTNLGELSLVYEIVDPQSNTVDSAKIGTVPYTDADWYEKTAGVVELSLDSILEDVEDHPLALVLSKTSNEPAITESPVYVRADQYVFRMNPEEEVEVNLFATRFGKPYPGARIVLVLDPSQLQAQAQSSLAPAPQVGAPELAIGFPARLVTDQSGRASFRMSAKDPGNPRDYIDGQIYGVRPVLEETLFANYPFNPLDFISVLVWSKFKPDDPPTWWGSIQPIFQLYANLYPVMKRFLDMSDYNSVCENRDLLLLAFSRGADNPNSMPVTRDLSRDKRDAILRWLKDPKLGTPREETAVAAAARPPASVGHPLPKGGKALAMSRRLGLRHFRR